MKNNELYLGLGTNLGDRAANLQDACDAIAHVYPVVRTSGIVETEAWGYESEYRYFNQVIVCYCEDTPEEVLNNLQNIEKLLGRTHKTVDRDYQDRPIDIDILIYGERVIKDKDLTVPHPLMAERDFVKEPLKEVITVKMLEFLKKNKIEIL